MKDGCRQSEISTSEFTPNTDLRNGVIDNLYQEVYAPHEQGVVLEPSRLDDSGYEWDLDMVDNAHVFREDDVWYMTYVGFYGDLDDDGGYGPDSGYTTGLARSVDNDLTTWEKLGAVLEPGPSGDWDDSNTAGYIAREHQWGDAPEALRTQGGDNRYLMSYLGSGSSIPIIR